MNAITASFRLMMVNVLAVHLSIVQTVITHNYIVLYVQTELQMYK